MDKEIKAKLKAYAEAYAKMKLPGKDQKIVENSFEENKKVNLYLKRSQDDYLLAQAVKKIIDDPDLRKQIELPPDYPNIFHWLIIISYYSMYHSATAAIAQKRVKCKSHEATIASIAKHYATSEELEFDFINTLHATYIDYIESGRDARRGAQYNVDKLYNVNDAFEVFDNAGKFIKRIQQILE